jgi:aspartate racemase
LQNGHPSKSIVKRSLGVIGGLGAVGSADIFYKLVKSVAARGEGENLDIIFEQHPFEEEPAPGAQNARTTARKLYVFNMIKQFEQRKVDAVVIPCFISHTFLDEIKSEVGLQIISMMEALQAHIARRIPGEHTLGILTTDYVKKSALFEKFFPSREYSLLYPSVAVQEHSVMESIYGTNGVRKGHVQGMAVDLLFNACEDLLARGAQVIVPGATEISVVADVLRERGMPIIDINQVYAQFAIDAQAMTTEKAFKVGIVGGVGPAATVDFMNKIISQTPGKRDQDHIKIVLEHNPQIPDRTENLVANGPDPTVALYSACKRLEANDANMIAIPCNTAHAYVERIQPYLSIPIINMLYETMSHIRRKYGEHKIIGLLATSGTIDSRVYHDIAAKENFNMIVPDSAHQEKVMASIYGPSGVKAGCISETALSDLKDAMEHLVMRGAEIIVLGCSELPILHPQMDDARILGKKVAILDPTAILAKRCVELSGVESA